MRGSILLYEKVMRLDKFLADAGLGTRSEAKKLLKKNKITVNDISKAADVNSDGLIDIKDLLKIQKYILGYTTIS